MRVGGLEGDAGAWELGLGERLGIRRERFGKETGTRGLELAERLGSCRGRLGEGLAFRVPQVASVLGAGQVQVA